MSSQFDFPFYLRMVLSNDVSSVNLNHYSQEMLNVGVKRILEFWIDVICVANTMWSQISTAKAKMLECIILIFFKYIFHHIEII